MKNRKLPVTYCSEEWHKRMCYPYEAIDGKSLNNMLGHHKEIIGYNIEDATDPERVHPVIDLGFMGDLNRQGQELEANIQDMIDADKPCISDWPKKEGWHVWNESGWRECDPPEYEVMILDTETHQVDKDTDTWIPRVAIALTSDGKLYYWHSLDPNVDIIPFGKGNLIVAHNANYDRQWLSSEYSLDMDTNRFLCTMSLVTCCRGMSNQQLPIYKKGVNFKWVGESTTPGLSAAYKFYTGCDLPKDVRDDIVGYGIHEGNLKSVSDYCYSDVKATQVVLSHVWGEYTLLRPNYFSSLGLLAMSTEVIPLSNDWEKYKDNAENLYQKTLKDVSDMVMNVAEEVASRGNDGSLALQSLDWTKVKRGYNKGMPAWFAKLRNEVKKGSFMTPHKRSIALALGIRYDGLEVWWNDKAKSPGFYAGDKPVPHPENNTRVTDMFIDGFLPAYDSGLLTCDRIEPQSMKILTSTVNWKQIRNRIFDVKYKDTEHGKLVVPQGSSIGTATGRKADKLWVVIPGAKKSRIGTETKMMVQAPPGYSMVGMDFDGQELRLASMLGESGSHYGHLPLSALSASGIKSQGTDPHSVIAESMGCTRNEAKPALYGAIYGQGMSGLLDHLRSCGLGGSKLKKAAQGFMDRFKGSNYRGQLSGGIASDLFNSIERILKTSRENLFGSRMPFSLYSVDKDFKPTRFNWTVQSSGRDLLDLLLATMATQIQLRGLNARLILTIHDEVHYLCPDNEVDELVDLMFHAHAFCYASAFAISGFKGVPASFIYPESIEVDKLLRKTCHDDCVTPSQPNPVPPGKEITREEWMKGQDLI